MSVDFFGIPVDEDIRGRLVTNSAGGPWEVIQLAQKLGVVVHYAGGAQNRDLSAIARFQAYARWHIRPGGFSGFTGNGLMYHLGIGEDGRVYGCYDPRVARWHAGSGHHNRFYVSINIPLGGNQRATQKQKESLERVCRDLIKLGVGKDVKTVIGHMEASHSLCPGTLMPDFVRPLRAGEKFMPDKPAPKPEPDHLIITVPGVGKFWIIHEIYKRYVMVDEPLFIFGYPLTGQKGNRQEFERARLHHEPGTWPERHDVHLALVGVELCEKRYGSVFKNKEDQFKPDQKVDDTSSRKYFDQTGFVVKGNFLKFWNAWGGLEYFGYPISREFKEGDLTVQYFERSRFEHHPNSNWHKDYFHTALGRVNYELLSNNP